MDHLKAFHSIEAIAEEKAKVIACLPQDGTAVLNADDPRVIAMADRFAGKIITFGLAKHALLRAEQVRAAWPERLSFTAVYQGRAVEVRTRLCGTHWTRSDEHTSELQFTNALIVCRHLIENKNIQQLYSD